MAIGNGAAAIAGELEKVHSSVLEKLFQFDSVIWDKIKARPKDNVSQRPERIVFQVSNGAKSRATGLDGQDLGRGGGPQFVYGNVTPVAFDWIIEWTKLAEIATDSREKAVIDYVSRTIEAHSETAAFNIDSMFSYGDGANTLGTVTAYDNVNFIVTVDNARRFYVNQDVDDWSGLGGTNRGTFTITGIDSIGNQLYLNAAPGFTPTAGDLLLENNSIGTAGSGLNGILALQNYSTSGFYAGIINKATYPGLFNTPAVNANGTTLTPAIARLLLNQLKLARGVKAKPGADVMLHMGLDQQAAWENTGINVTQNIQSGNATGRDMLAANQVSTISGIPILANIKAIPGRIDLIDFSTYYRVETAPLDMYKVGNDTIFPVYGASGGIASSMVSYMIWMGNFMCENPRANAVLYNLTVPTGY